MKDPEISDLLQALRVRELRIVTAESLTAGGIANALTRVAGASRVVNGGLIVYTNDMKTKLLGVPKPMLDKFTAVSAPVAQAMALGALERTGSDIAVAVTGYAGPAAGPKGEDMSGVVFIGIARNFNAAADNTANVWSHQFSGSREEIREKTINAALEHVRETLTLYP